MDIHFHDHSPQLNPGLYQQQFPQEPPTQQDNGSTGMRNGRSFSSSHQGGRVSYAHLGDGNCDLFSQQQYLRPGRPLPGGRERSGRYSEQTNGYQHNTSTGRTVHNGAGRSNRTSATGNFNFGPGNQGQNQGRTYWKSPKGTHPPMYRVGNGYPFSRFRTGWEEDEDHQLARPDDLYYSNQNHGETGSYGPCGQPASIQEISTELPDEPHVETGQQPMSSHLSLMKQSPNIRYWHKGCTDQSATDEPLLDTEERVWVGMSTRVRTRQNPESLSIYASKTLAKWIYRIQHVLLHVQAAKPLVFLEQMELLAGMHKSQPNKKNGDSIGSIYDHLAPHFFPVEAQEIIDCKRNLTQGDRSVIPKLSTMMRETRRIARARQGELLEVIMGRNLSTDQVTHVWMNGQRHIRTLLKRRVLTIPGPSQFSEYTNQSVPALEAPSVPDDPQDVWPDLERVSKYFVPPKAPKYDWVRQVMHPRFGQTMGKGRKNLSLGSFWPYMLQLNQSLADLLEESFERAIDPDGICNIPPSRVPVYLKEALVCNTLPAKRKVDQHFIPRKDRVPQPHSWAMKSFDAFIEPEMEEYDSAEENNTAQHLQQLSLSPVHKKARWDSGDVDPTFPSTGKVDLTSDVRSKTPQSGASYPSFVPPSPLQSGSTSSPEAVVEDEQRNVWKFANKLTQGSTHLVPREEEVEGCTGGTSERKEPPGSFSEPHPKKLSNSSGHRSEPNKSLECTTSLSNPAVGDSYKPASECLGPGLQLSSTSSIGVQSEVDGELATGEVVGELETPTGNTSQPLDTTEGGPTPTPNEDLTFKSVFNSCDQTDRLRMARAMLENANNSTMQKMGWGPASNSLKAQTSSKSSYDPEWMKSSREFWQSGIREVSEQSGPGIEVFKEDSSVEEEFDSCSVLPGFSTQESPGNDNNNLSQLDSDTEADVVDQGVVIPPLLLPPRMESEASDSGSPFPDMPSTSSKDPGARAKPDNYCPLPIRVRSEIPGMEPCPSPSVKDREVDWSPLSLSDIAGHDDEGGPFVNSKGGFGEAFHVLESRPACNGARSTALESKVKPFALSTSRKPVPEDVSGPPYAGPQIPAAAAAPVPGPRPFRPVLMIYDRVRDKITGFQSTFRLRAGFYSRNVILLDHNGQGFNMPECHIPGLTIHALPGAHPDIWWRSFNFANKNDKRSPFTGPKKVLIFPGFACKTMVIEHVMKSCKNMLSTALKLFPEAEFVVSKLCIDRSFTEEENNKIKDFNTQLEKMPSSAGMGVSKENRLSLVPCLPAKQINYVAVPKEGNIPSKELNLVWTHDTCLKFLQLWGGKMAQR